MPDTPTPAAQMSPAHTLHRFPSHQSLNLTNNGSSTSLSSSPISPTSTRSRLRNSLNLTFMKRRSSKSDDTKIKTPQDQIFHTSYSYSPSYTYNDSIMSPPNSVSTCYTSPPHSNPQKKKSPLTTTKASFQPFNSAPPPVIKPFVFSGKVRFVENDTCAICEEPLHFILAGERKLVLECKHIAHEQCYMEFLTDDVVSPDDKDLVPLCPVCGEKSKPVDESQWNDLYQERLRKARQLEREDAINQLIKSSPGKAAGGVDILLWPLAKEKTPAISCAAAKPMVQVQVNKQPDTPQSPGLSYMSLKIDVSPDDYDGGRDAFIGYHEVLSPRDATVPSQRDPVMDNLLASIADWGRHDPNTLGTVKCVDLVEVSTDQGATYKSLVGFLFEDLILFVENAFPGEYASKTLFPGSNIKGSLVISKHVASVINGTDISIFVNSTNSPELRVNVPGNQDEWFKTLVQLYRGNRLDSPFLPQRCQMSPPLMSPAKFPSPVDAPLDLVVVVPIGSSNDTQIKMLQKIVRDILDSMTHLDRLSLLLVGCGPDEKSSYGASSSAEYIALGLASPEWAGWDHSINSLNDPSVRGGGTKKVTLEAWAHAKRLLETRESKNTACAIFMISETQLIPNQEMSHPSSPTKVFTMNQLDRVVGEIQKCKKRRIGYARLSVETEHDTIVQIYDSPEADSHQSANGGHATFTFPLYFGSSELKLAIRGVPPSKFSVSSCEGQFETAECYAYQSLQRPQA
ncbi:hypothetical protein CJU90_5604 [Yarrowia sp. C11]|nr:hypothetical protein CJU90_5604 [Yarrowia sp. C11]